jgi:hypothetical protein
MSYNKKLYWRYLLGAAISLTMISEALAEPFTIAVIPDTQNYVDYKNQRAEGFAFDASTQFLEQMAYVAANLKSAGGDIAFVTALGDVWQHQTLAIDPEHAARGFKRGANPVMDAHFAPTEKVKTVEMPMAVKGYEMIAGKTPFSIVPGNHDYDGMWTDANHLPDAKGAGFMLHAGGTRNFTSVFGKDSKFFKDKSWYVDSFNGGADSAQIFTAGGYTFLHIGLEFDAPNKALAWAAEVIKKHPGLPTIVSTHDYLEERGRRLANPIIDNNAVDPEDNNPEMVWQKFISQHDQIFMVLCGHEHAQAFRVDNNRFGHKVYQVLADYQARTQTLKDAGVTPVGGVGVGDGWLRLMTFDLGAASPVVRVSTYSTHYKKFSRDTAEYAAWYREHDQPGMSDSQFYQQDDYAFDLTDFRARFDKTAKAR